ncbi:unnamed protein product [Dovyalis caffra]|uniref:WAT1-related protein n=1 Tax=Dovyalis caffra TaxID=77055 RepID=A0AAV1RWQ0_9ROSI|nr:unnamed protein product [Dovyalis caffra]
MDMADVLPFLAMVIVQFGFAGMNITSKLAMDSGMKPLVLVCYRQIFATIAIVPFAYFFERKSRPKITKSLLFQIFLCSLTGVTGNQVFYFTGLEKSTPTIGCALANILPAATFILAVLCRQESVGIKKISGQAKLLGTLVCVGGAIIECVVIGIVANHKASEWSLRSPGRLIAALYSECHELSSITTQVLLTQRSRFQTNG